MYDRRHADVIKLIYDTHDTYNVEWNGCERGDWGRVGREGREEGLTGCLFFYMFVHVGEYQRTQCVRVAYSGYTRFFHIWFKKIRARCVCRTYILIYTHAHM